MTEPHARLSAGNTSLTFQKRVVEWLMACFSMEVCRDGIERNHRFLEEALELVQSLECTRSEAHQLVDYVFNRPVGDPKQELGGALVTLTALANCHDMNMMEAGETELARVWTKIDKIRAKQAAKPKHSPLPEHVPVDAQGSLDIPPERHRTDEQRADIQRAWDLIGNNDEIILNSTDGHLAVLRAIQLGRALAAQPPAAPVETKRKTFTIPPGHEAVRRLRSSSVPSDQRQGGGDAA